MSRIAVFVSGNGTHLPWLIKGFEVVAVVCNNPQANALRLTEDVPTLCLDHQDYSTRGEWEEVAHAFLTEHRVDLIVLAGFMRILTPSFIRKWPRKILNVHPSLLPAFPGAHAIQDAMDYGVRVTGATVHFVDEGVDTGPIITQINLCILGSDTLASLKKQIQHFERVILTAAVKIVSKGNYRIEGRKVLLT